MVMAIFGYVHFTDRNVRATVDNKKPSVGYKPGNSMPARCYILISGTVK